MSKELDYETISQHNLEVTVTDNSPVSNNRRTTTANLEIRVINIDDSEMYTAKVRMIQPFIASPANPAGLAGIPDRAALEILLVYENGTEVDITMEGGRYTMDDSSKSNNLFSVENNGAPYVIANDGGLAGTGQLLVHVTNVDSVVINITVVGSKSLTVKAVPHSEISDDSEVTELKQIIPGKYQRVNLKVLLGLTNGDTKDVSTSPNTSFAFTNAPQVGGTFEFGPVPRNLFSIEGSGLSGDVSLQAEFAGSLSGSVNLSLSSTVLKAIAITRFGLEDVNTTLSGTVGTTVSPFAELKMEDGSTHLINNFSRYSGLLGFTSSDPASAQIHPSSGVVILVADSSSWVKITATLVGNSSIAKEFAFYCNLEPSVGEIDVGATEGAAIPSLSDGVTWKMPIRVNPGSAGILAVHVEVKFSANDLSLDGVTTGLPYTIVSDTIYIFGPVVESKAMSEHIGEVAFTSKKSGIPQVNVTFFRTVNKELSPVPPKNVPSTPCSDKKLGDIDLDCEFDIVDVAYISGYITASSKSRFTDEITKLMDVTWNEAIENNDATFLSLIYLEKAKFVTELKYQIPDHDGESCGLEFTVKLANKDGSPASPPQAEVFFLFSHPGANVGAQLDRTSFTAGTKLTVDGAVSVDGLIKASYENGKYFIAATNSELESSDVGVSILQEVPFDGKKQVVSMFLTSDLVSNVSVTTWVKNQPSFTPQRKLQFSESTTTCNDPSVTFPVEITFEGDYDEVVKGKEQEFQSQCESKLSEMYPDATVTNCRVRKGSIVASFNMTVPKSKREETVNKLWEDVKEGLKFEFNGATLTTLPIMKVDGDTKKVESEPKEEDRMSAYIIVVACVAAFVIILIIVIAVFCLYRKRKETKINPTPPVTPEVYIDSGKEPPSVQDKYVKTSGSSAWSARNTPEPQGNSQFRYATPLAFADTVEPAFEEKEEQLPDSQVTLCFNNIKTKSNRKYPDGLCRMTIIIKNFSLRLSLFRQPANSIRTLSTSIMNEVLLLHIYRTTFVNLALRCVGKQPILFPDLFYTRHKEVWNRD